MSRRPRANHHSTVKSEVDRLRSETFDSVQSMDRYTVLADASVSKNHTVSVWKDVLDSGNIRVVVQSYEKRFLVCGTIYADGLVFSQAGEITEVPIEELWSFM